MFRTFITSGSLAYTEYWEGEPGAMERVYPCRCGETHRGDYAAYDYGHHNCFHSGPLMRFEDAQNWYLCGECGEVFTSICEGPILPKEG